MLFKHKAMCMRSHLVAAAAILATTTITHAGTNSNGVTPLVIVGINGSGSYEQFNLSLDQFTESNNHYKLNEPTYKNNVLNNTTSIELKELEFDPDPFVLNNLLVTNNSGMTQSYFAAVVLPAALAAPNLIGGSITTQVIDGDAVPGATISAPMGESIYTALIDGAPVHTLQDDPFSISAPPGNVNNALASFGFVGSAIPVTANIGIILRFELTAGDSAAILSRFDVIPTPASTSLIVLSTMFCAHRRRR